MLMYFFRGGNLPWLDVETDDPIHYIESVTIKKNETSIEELTLGYPKEYRDLLNYARKLKFAEKPDYQRLITIFKEAFERQNFVLDFKYDWILKKEAL